MAGEFRRYLFPHDHPRLAEVRGMDPHAYREHARTPGTFTGGLVEGWTPLYLAPFRGVTEDGVLRDGLYPLTPAGPGEEAPVAAMVAAAETLLGLLTPEDRARVCLPVDAPEWQTWANPEFMQFDTGLRLEFQPPEVREAALALVRASLSPEGAALVHAAMLVNGFLGDVVDLPTVLGDWSYNVALYGTPDLRAPWGWQLYGHHCAVNVLVVEGRMAVSPVFVGAEPDEIDDGPHAGVSGLFADRIETGLGVMAALTPEQRAQATVYEQMVDPAMPPGRVHPGDERHLAGAFQDNRVIPVEGVRCSEVSEEARARVLDVVATFVRLLPEGPRTARLREVEAHLDETWFSWIGGHAPGDVFYYRVQSPVVIAELDHHCGVFLDYDTPKPFHVHTVLRTPHGNDYGRAWVREWQSQHDQVG
ncbi:DUF3500 domain-containing protein [Geodermatophilus aquaeductus]|uniref:DUF3500 domain-containing protein n=1 Tax=Geodermatophilus aquaeductus TaxID=1564161 RepID=A0A521FIJ1_9ACTN|nr:DUF3500 domain-containing protein [Geodermatophilus aquaeductus]SMO95965.1 Protein of unknown function [Geodermatophilus aquaeductus]